MRRSVERFSLRGDLEETHDGFRLPTGVVLFIGLTGWIAALLQRLVPGGESPGQETTAGAKAPT